MATITQFEEIEAWQVARQLVGSVYRATSDGAFARDFGLRDQIRRAAVSIMANIAEGFERSSNREFVQFLYIAKGSSSEVRSHLYVAYDLGYLNEQPFQELSKANTLTSRLVSKFIDYLRGTPITSRTIKPTNAPTSKESR